MLNTMQNWVSQGIRTDKFRAENFATKSIMTFPIIFFQNDAPKRFYVIATRQKWLYLDISIFIFDKKY